MARIVRKQAWPVPATVEAHPLVDYRTVRWQIALMHQTSGSGRHGGKGDEGHRLVRMNAFVISRGTSISLYKSTVVQRCAL